MVALLLFTASVAVRVVMPEGAQQGELWSIALMVCYCALVMAALIRQARYRRKAARRE